MISWKKDKNTLFIKFEDLLKNKKDNLDKISNFLNIKLPNFQVRKRKNSSSNLPKFILDEIKKEY